MSARRQIIAALSEDSMGGIATLEDVAHAEQMVDAHRNEVLAKAVGRLRAIPVQCTALTGPVWYGDGWNSAITQLEEIADYQTPDDEAYPGELQRLRTLALQLRVAGIRKEDLAEVQRLLTFHEDWRKKATDAQSAAATDAATATLRSLHTAVYGALCNFPQADQFSSLAHAQVRNLLADHLTGALHHDGWVQRDEAAEEKTTPEVGAAVTPDFFQPGRTYTDGNGFRAPELINYFRVEHVTRHPDRGHLRAIGWLRSGAAGAGWHGDFRDDDEFDGWTDVTEAGDR